MRLACISYFWAETLKRHRFEGPTVDGRVTRCEHVDRAHVARYIRQSHALMNTAMHLRVPRKTRNYLIT